MAEISGPNPRTPGKQGPADIGINQDRETETFSRKKRREPDLDPLAGPDGGPKGRRLAAFWLDKIIEADDDKEFKRWLKRGSAIEKRYRDERNRTDEEGQRRYNSLWANIEILRPALYGKCPIPVCERRFKDKDPVGRGAAQILERALRNEIEICGFNEAMQQAILDYLLPGRGVVWVRYEPKIGEGPSIPTDDDMDVVDSQGQIIEEDDSESEEKLAETGERIERESTPIDYIQWTDFYLFPAKARTRREVTAAAKRVYMTRNQMIDRFGEKIGRAIPFQKDDRRVRRQEDTSVGHEVEEKAQLYEIWDKDNEEVLWVAEGYQYLCDRKDDPLELDHFFPFPWPLHANPTNNTLIPVPDFIQYQDQAIIIDELTQRISMLAKACKVAGVYNAAAKGIQRLFNESVENEMIPVDDWTAFAEKGGVAGNLSFIPLKEIIGVIEELTKVKERAIQEMDRLTGINDVMRGQGQDDSRETLGSKRLKSNASGSRLQWRQNEIGRFARDTLRIMADIMCKHFSDESLINVSGAMYEEGLGTTNPPSPPDLTTTLQNPNSPLLAPPSSSPPGGANSGPPQAAPQAPGAAPGGPSLPPPQAPPSNGGVAASPPGAPPQPGAAPGGQIMPPQPGQQPGPPGFQGPMPPPGMPPIPPEILDHIQGMMRIKRSLGLLRDEQALGFRVDIEVDSTIFADEDKEKTDRTAFIAAVTKFLTESMQITMAMPNAASLLGKMLQFGVRGFNVGRELEQAIEDFTDEAMIAAKQHQQMSGHQPDPQMVKAQADMLKAKASAQSSQFKIESDKQKAAAEIKRQELENQGEQATAQSDLEQKQADAEMRKLEIEIKKIELQINMIKAKSALEIEQQKAQTARQQSQADMQKTHMDMQMQGQQMQNQQQQMAHDREMSQSQMAHDQQMQSSQQQMAQGQQQHDQQMQHGERQMAQTQLQQEAVKATQPQQPQQQGSLGNESQGQSQQQPGQPHQTRPNPTSSTYPGAPASGHIRHRPRPSNK